MPAVSVIIPVYNVQKYLPKCLDSVICQTFKDIEIICVNDGSTDGSATILKEYSNKDSRIKTVDQENKGPAHARNRGLSEVNGDYIQFLDSDDWLELTAIEKAYSRIVEDNADVCIYRFFYYYMEKASKIDAKWSLQKGLVPKNTPFNYSDLCGVIFRFTTPSVCNKLFRRSFLHRHKILFNTELKRAEDLPFAFLCLALADRITVVEEPLINYRFGNQGSQQSTINRQPTEICKALYVARQDIIRAGRYDFLERDFINAALHQCLYSLETIKTANGYKELYGSLKNHYIEQLGIKNKNEEYFYDDINYYKSYDINLLSMDEYLFKEVCKVRKTFIEVNNKYASALKSIEARKKELDDVKNVLLSTKNDLLSTKNDLNQQITISSRLKSGLNEMERINKKMESLNKKQENEINILSNHIDVIHRSVAYKAGRFLTFIPRKMRHYNKLFFKRNK